MYVRSGSPPPNSLRTQEESNGGERGALCDEQQETCIRNGNGRGAEETETGVSWELGVTAEEQP